MDHDIQDSIKHLNQNEKRYGAWTLPKDDWYLQTEEKATREPLLTWAPNDHKGFKKNYFIPNFGEDENVVSTQQNVNAAEVSTGHTWNWAKAGKPNKMDYFVPNFGLDNEVVATKQSASEAEVSRNHKWIPAEPAKIKRDYFIPNFGNDEDLAT